MCLWLFLHLCNEEGAATLIFNFTFMVAVYFSFFLIKTLCLVLYFWQSSCSGCACCNKPKLQASPGEPGLRFYESQLEIGCLELAHSHAVLLNTCVLYIFSWNWACRLLVLSNGWSALRGVLWFTTINVSIQTVRTGKTVEYFKNSQGLVEGDWKAISIIELKDNSRTLTNKNTAETHRHTFKLDFMWPLNCSGAYVHDTNYLVATYNLIKMLLFLRHMLRTETAIVHFSSWIPIAIQEWLSWSHQSLKSWIYIFIFLIYDRVVIVISNINSASETNHGL